MWINRDVDLPQALITAQRNGRLVVFAGAGVSIGAPSNLPSFGALAEAVAAGVLTLKEGEPLDAFLGRLEVAGVDVQSRTRAQIDRPTSLPRPVHSRIANLFRSEDVVRIVTTNFDRHFTATVREAFPNIDVSIGPALPLGRECQGLIYLHGAVEKPRSHLVLTDADFGRAYLTDGWATRFLAEMFLEFVVLFVGYSHQDVVMKYLARSFVRGTARFALARDGDDEHWIGLGVTPVHFPMRAEPQPFGAIDDALDSWSRHSAMGVFDHQARIVQLVEAPPSPDPESADYMRLALANEVTLRFFTASARRLEWFNWLEAEGFFNPLVSTAPITTREPQLLAQWFADHFLLQHTRGALAFVQRHAATVNPLLCDHIAFALGHRATEVSPDALRIWSTALLAIETCPPESLTRLLLRCAEDGVVDSAALLFRNLAQPRLRFERPWTRADQNRIRLDVEVGLRGEGDDLQEVWTSTIVPHLPTLHQQLLPMATEYLQNAWASLVAAGRADDRWDPMSHGRSAIEPHEQDHLPKDWSLLVDIARDVLDWLLVNNPPLAYATIDAWSVSLPQLLTRLAIYGTGKRADLQANDALVLIEQRAWLFKSPLKHEVFELLARKFPTASEEFQRRFIAHSMIADALAGARPAEDVRRSIEYERYNLAVWLQRIAPGSVVAAEHFDTLQRQHPDFGPRDHPDMGHWISGGFIGPQSPITAQALLAMAAREATTYLMEYEPGEAAFRGPDRGGLLSIFQRTAAGALPWSLAIADELIVRAIWPQDVWASLLNAWRTAPLEDADCIRVVTLLDAHPAIGEGAPDATADLVRHFSERRDLPIVDVERIEQIGDRVLPIANHQPPSVRRGEEIDWLTSAINHAGGEIAFTWLNTLGRRMTAAGDEWHGIPDFIRARFETLLGGDGPNAVLARVAFASQTHFLFHADRTWTEEHVLPLFDWDTDAVRAGQAWQGFLVWGLWPDALFERMEPFVRRTFGRLNNLPREQQEAFTSRLAGVAAFSPTDPWRNRGWLFEFLRATTAEHRAEWAADFGRYVQSLTPDGAEALWNRWFSDYWATRLTGVPQALDEAEKRAMVAWTLAFTTHFAQVVERVLAAAPATLDHFTLYQLQQSGLAESHAAEMGRLLRGLLRAATSVQFDTGEVLNLATTAFAHGANREDLLTVAEDMVRLQCQGADTLRGLVNGPI